MDKLPDTIEECHRVIRLLLKAIDDLSKRVEALEIENRDLKERLNNNSSNSSLPPSRSQKKKKNRREPSDKKAGGQPGHKGHYRELLPTNQVDSIQRCLLPKNCGCSGKIKPSGKHIRHQVYELPILKLVYWFSGNRTLEIFKRRQTAKNYGITFQGALPLEPRSI